LNLRLIAGSGVKFWSGTAGVVNLAVEWKIFKSTIFSHEVDWAMTLPRI
jgi:hypothetical protein